MNNLGEMIKAFRKKSGLTQLELAELLKVSFSTLRRWEVYGVQPRADEVKRLCDVFHCTETELLSGSVEERSKITLSYDFEKFEKGDVDMTGKGYDIFLGAEGVIGFKGSMLFNSREAIEDCLTTMREQLMIAYDAQVRRGAIKETF